MSDPVREVEEAVDRYRAGGWPEPGVLLVSGSGLAVELAGRRHGPVPLGEWLPFAVEGIEGHPLSAELLEPAPGLRVLYQRGRIHSYQGFDAHRTALVARLAARLGARTLVMTNAAGGLRRAQAPGDLVLIRDHLNLTGLNPLRGSLPEEWGPRFPDMTRAYAPELRRLARRHAAELGIELSAGVYAGVAGPSYETPAEVSMLRTLGADLVGMSTVLEVIAARHLGLRCLCLSLVSNRAAGVTDEPLDHEEVLDAGRIAARSVRRLFDRLLADPELYGGGDA